jgi:hypothetical protein
LRIVKGPNVKKLLTLVALAALALPAMPVGAAQFTQTGTVDVNWNTTASGTITLYADYGSGSTSVCATESTGCGTPAVLTNTTGGGSCTAAPTAPTALTGAAGSSTGVFFGSISPDTAKNIECYYQDAVDAVLTTNDASYSVTAQITGSTNDAGYWLCYAANGTWPTSAATKSAATAAPTGYTTSGAVAACPTGTTQIPSASAATLLTGTATANAAHVGADYALIVPALSTSGAAQMVVTYTFTGN